MARPLRIEYPGAIYHVLSRGDRREAVVCQYLALTPFFSLSGLSIILHNGMKLKARIAITTVIALAMPLWSAGEDETLWTKAFIRDLDPDLEISKGPIFYISAIEYKSGELTAICSFSNFESPKHQSVKVSIEGEWREGFFWPIVKGQVGDHNKGPWYSIPIEAKKKQLSKVEVLPGQEIRKWRVRLNDFLPYVGNYEVGRVVIASGEFAVFSLMDLKGSQDGK